MTCLHCINFDLLNLAMAKQDYGHCKHDPTWMFTGINANQCARFIAAPAGITEKRIAWRDKSK